jgi:FlaA1/EpsC-like NDP-sugar epimerase
LSQPSAALLEVVRRHRQLVSLCAFATATTLAYAVAFWTSFELNWPTGYEGAFVTSLVVLVLIRVVSGHACGLATHRWRFIGVGDIRRLALAVGVGTLAFVPLAGRLNLDPPVPTTVLVLEPVFTLLFMAGVWLSYRTAFEMAWRHQGATGPARKVIVVGAGEAGEALVRQMLLHPTGYRPVAFADDDLGRGGTSIHGVRVMGRTHQLAEIAQRTQADEIVIAIPSARPLDLRRIVERCEPTGLPFRVLPHIAQVLDGDVSLNQLREVRIEDLLGRDPVDLELPELARDLSGKVVLITGAAGSIGSELARQVAQNGPRRLVLLDQSETGLFYLELELRDLTPDLEIIPVVADVVDSVSVERTFALHRPGRVFHAAAYKHVPMMESNEREALRNNIMGTWWVADAAGRHGAEKFVLVSTDKAVRPVNVMGATKRVAELLVLELQGKYASTMFGAVRFGNVLGSAGSVVPVFKRQLEEGKPLTVTHPEITRYFMTIPEAAQLVLQASLLPELQGRIAMLDMGRPVRILDLARTLVRLSGGRRDREPIVFTGLRPGEKLHEELEAPDERAGATRIPKIRILHPNGAVRHAVIARIDRWDRLLAAWQPDPVMEDLLEIVPELRNRGGAELGVPAAHAPSVPQQPASLGVPASRTGPLLPKSASRPAREWRAQ